jgi:hypothetical protein
MKIEPDMQAFEAALKRLAQLQRKTMEEVVLDQGALFCRDAIKLHPPFGKTPLVENPTVQKAVGLRAVQRDVSRYIRGINNAKGIRDEKVAKAIRRLGRKGKESALQAILKDAGYKRVAGVVGSPSEAQHNSSRNTRGRVKKGTPQYFTWNNAAVEGFKKRKKEEVGRAKAGWIVALGEINAMRGKSTFRIPAWVARHHGEPGTFNATKTDDKFGIVCSNAIPFAQKHKARIEREGWIARTIAAPKHAEAIYQGMLKRGRRV